ncbi:hypothetical protein D3C71_159060 [compost metagenome]
MRKLLLLLISNLFLISASTEAATQITTATVSGNWTLEGSPYYIHNDISVSYNNLLTIHPGVQVVFMGNYQIIVQGKLSAVGTPEQKITFRANDTTGWSNPALTTAGGWRGMVLLNSIGTSMNTPTLEYCIFKDLKNGGLQSSGENLFINQCEFYHNHTNGHMINLANFPSTGNAKMKFTNSVLHDNLTAGAVMFTLYADSTYITNNKFYNNTNNGGLGIYCNAAFADTSTGVLMFKNNELYNNTVISSGGVVNCLQGGIVNILNNKVHHNQTTFQGSVSVQSKKALVEQNLISNNQQILGDGVFCGINDGGGGLHLLGQILMSDVAGKNEYTVRNNIIANNYSSTSGAAIWAQHCKATIINNTIMNNTVKDATGSAAVHGWGTYCRLKISNNIILNNKQNAIPADTVYNNFRYWGPEISFSKNLIDYLPTSSIIAGAQGINTNIYKPSAYLAAPPQGVGPTVNAVTANFSLTAASADCINKGSMATNTYGTLDYLGNERVFEQLVDIGAIEYQKTTADTSTALNTIAAEQYFKVYPNPTKGVLYLEYDAQQHKVSQADIFTINGQLVQQVSLKGGSAIDVSALAEGIYMMRLITGKQEIAYKKFIISK